MLDLYKFLTHLPDTVVLLSPDLKVLEATDAYLRVTLRTREQLIGKDFLKEFPDNPHEPESKNQQLLRQSLEKVLCTMEPDFLEVLRYDIPAADGSFDVRYWEAVHTPVLDEAGKVHFIIQKTADVTEREQNKHALALQESKFRFMADAMPQLIYMTDEHGTINYLNKRWFDYTGHSASDLAWENTIHPDDLDALHTKWEKARQSVTPFQVEARIQDGQGRYRWHLTRAIPMQDKTGNVMMWVGSSTDIHESRLLVQELLSSNEQMVAMADQLQATYQKAEAERKVMEQLIQKAPFFCCILKGPTHRFELANENYQKLMPAKELIGKPVAEALPEVVEQGFTAILDQVYQTGEEFVAESMPVKLDRFNTGTLEDVYVTFIYQAMRNEQEEIVGILVFGHDVTEQTLFMHKAKDLGISLS